MRPASAIARLGLVALTCSVLGGCAVSPGSLEAESPREDGAYEVEIPRSGSLQNPAFSPDGGSILVTSFRNGYNSGPADLLVVHLHLHSVRVLVSDGSGNINSPGSCWNRRTGQIVFASTREPHDEVYMIGAGSAPGGEVRITSREETVAYEATLSPDGEWVVFESHRLDEEGNGVITTYRVDGTEPYRALTSETDDCRQPNWSPMGDLIAYQSFSEGQWDVWVMNADGGDQRKITSGAGDKTDPSFSPDGRWVVCSWEMPEDEGADLYMVPVDGGRLIRVTRSGGYDGAASWSPEGEWIVFESCPGDPDESGGTRIWMIHVGSR